MSQSSPGLQDFFFTFLVHPVRWLAPTVLIAAAALVYAISTPKQWRATQAIAVRNEAGAQPASLGRFDSIDEMQAYQETVMELARSRAVVSAALTDVGPTESMNSTEMFPSKEQIEKLQSAISSRAPNGAELGRTEVFYLQGKDRQPERAKRLVAAACNRLDEQFQDLRRRKAESLSSELEKNVHLTQDTLRDVTGRLTGVEQQVGREFGRWASSWRS